MGSQWNGQRCLEGQVVDNLYDGPEDCEKQIKAFAAKYANVGAMREGIRRNKEFYYKDVIDFCKNGTFDPDFFQEMVNGKAAGVLKEQLTKMAVAKKKKKAAKAAAKV